MFIKKLKKFKNHNFNFQKLSKVEIFEIACGQNHSMALGRDPEDLQQGKKKKVN